MPKIKYHCEICDFPYRTREEAEMCERQGFKPFAFEVLDVLIQLSPVLRQDQFLLLHRPEVQIAGRSRSSRFHENVYNVPGIREKPVGESYLKSNFEKKEK